MSSKQLRSENATLRKIAADFQIMAKRYADGRMSMALAWALWRARIDAK